MNRSVDERLNFVRTSHVILEQLFRSKSEEERAVEYDRIRSQVAQEDDPLSFPLFRQRFTALVGEIPAKGRRAVSVSALLSFLVEDRWEEARDLFLLAMASLPDGPGYRKLFCLRCDHIWSTRYDREPINCAACNSPYWNTPLKQLTLPEHAAKQLLSSPTRERPTIECPRCGRTRTHYARGHCHSCYSYFMEHAAEATDTFRTRSKTAAQAVEPVDELWI